MPDPVFAITLLLLVALVEWYPRPMVPIGVLLAIGMLLRDIDLGPVALIGACGVAVAQLLVAAGARRGRERAGSSPAARAQREALRARLASSSAFARITFSMAALPGPTSNFLFPMLGAMRAPLAPAVVGTIFGRTLLYVITTSLFVWLARVGASSDRDAADFLIVLATVFLVWRMIGWIDWRHRAETGSWRLRDPDASPLDARMFMGPHAQAPGGGASDEPASRVVHEDDVVEGEILGEEVDDDHPTSGDGDDSGPAGSLPRGS